jgi:beta-lactamase class C
MADGKPWPVLPNYYRVAPAPGVNASVLDMAKWLMAQLGANPAVVTPEIVETLITPRVQHPTRSVPQGVEPNC